MSATVFTTVTAIGKEFLGQNHKTILEVIIDAFHQLAALFLGIDFLHFSSDHRTFENGQGTLYCLRHP